MKWGSQWDAVCPGAQSLRSQGVWPWTGPSLWKWLGASLCTGVVENPAQKSFLFQVLLLYFFLTFGACSGFVCGQLT